MNAKKCKIIRKTLLKEGVDWREAKHVQQVYKDIGYLFSCLEDLPVATYSDGTKLHSTKQYKENRKNGVTVSSLITETKGGTPKHKHKPRPPNTDLDYKTCSNTNPDHQTPT